MPQGKTDYDLATLVDEEDDLAATVEIEYSIEAARDFGRFGQVADHRKWQPPWSTIEQALQASRFQYWIAAITLQPHLAPFWNVRSLD